MESETDANDAELDMSKDPVSEGIVPNWDDIEDKTEKAKELDSKTLAEMFRRGFAEGDMYNLMDSAIASSELNFRGYSKTGDYENAKYVKDGEEI